MQSVDNPDRLTDWLPGWLAGVIYVYSLFSKSKYPAAISLFISKRRRSHPLRSAFQKNRVKRTHHTILGVPTWLGYPFPRGLISSSDWHWWVVGIHAHTHELERNEQRPDTFHQILWFDEHCIWDNKKKHTQKSSMKSGWRVYISGVGRW